MDLISSLPEQLAGGWISGRLSQGSIVSALCNGLPNGSLIGNIMEDSKVFLSTITGATAADTLRQNNEVAYRVACYAFFEPPDIIIDVIISDCNVQTLLCCVLALFVVLASAYPFVPNILSMNQYHCLKKNFTILLQSICFLL
ncbi:unnamed protein product [Malus baccata var. baccata]